MRALLSTLGTTPQVVPEAFIAAGESYGCVDVLVTASERIDLAPIREFFAARPDVRLTLWRMRDLDDVANAAQQQVFEEILLRWYLRHRRAHEELDLCLSGGRKAMSASAQKAAVWLGAERVFHVLAPDSLRSAADIRARAGEIERVDLGSEAGWPSLRALNADDYPLETLPAADGCIDIIAPADRALCSVLAERVDLSRRKAEGFARAATLPFPSMALLPEAAAEWLEQPLDPRTDVPWVCALPKVELHCHLGGFATHGESLNAVRAAADCPPAAAWPDAPEPPPGWPLPQRPCGLETYMRLGDANGTTLLRDPGCLRAQCRLLYAHLLDQNVAYAEVRCSPGNYASARRPPLVVLQDIIEAFDHARAAANAAGHAHPPQVNLIVMATRREAGDLSSIARHLALAITAHSPVPRESCSVVGVDLAGLEVRETRAAYFAADFEPIHRCGLAVTAHAGENDDAEGIWQAVYKLHARRLGHALHLRQAPDLMRAVIERRIGVEMCPFANLQIKGFPLDAPDHPQAYPLLHYLRAGVPVTVNTDNIGISAASLNDNLLLLPRLCPGITRRDLLALIRNGLDIAFLPHSAKPPLLTALDHASHHATLRFLFSSN